MRCVRFLLLIRLALEVGEGHIDLMPARLRVFYFRLEDFARLAAVVDIDLPGAFDARATDLEGEPGGGRPVLLGMGETRPAPLLGRASRTFDALERHPVRLTFCAHGDIRREIRTFAGFDRWLEDLNSCGGRLRGVNRPDGRAQHQGHEGDGVQWQHRSSGGTLTKNDLNGGNIDTRITGVADDPEPAHAREAESVVGGIMVLVEC